MELADGATPNAPKLLGESKPPVAVLATPDGTPVSKLENKDGKLKVADVEKLVESEVKQRESALDDHLKEGEGQSYGGRQRIRDQALSVSCRREVHVPQESQGSRQRVEETWSR